MKDQKSRSAPSETEEAACLVSLCWPHSLVGREARAGTSDGMGVRRGVPPPSQGQYLAVSSRPHIQRAMSGFCRSSSHAWDHHLPCNIVRPQRIPWNPKVLVFLWIWYSFQLYCEQMFLRLL